MTKPSECKWCGCRDVERETVVRQSLIISYVCGTMSETDASGTRWLRCHKCAGRVGALYSRIRRALERLKSAERYDVESFEDVVSHNYYDATQQVDADCVDEVIRILEGVDNEQTD